MNIFCNSLLAPVALATEEPVTLIMIIRSCTAIGAVVTDWMNSPGHQQNILNPNYTEMGLGYSSNGNFWVQVFGG